MMYHRSDSVLNEQIKDLSKIRVPSSAKKIVLMVAVYLLLVPFVVSASVVFDLSILTYIYLIPMIPIAIVTYVVFTGKLKWLIKFLHAVHRFKNRKVYDPKL